MGLLSSSLKWEDVRAQNAKSRPAHIPEIVLYETNVHRFYLTTTCKVVALRRDEGEWIVAGIVYGSAMNFQLEDVVSHLSVSELPTDLLDLVEAYYGPGYINVYYQKPRNGFYGIIPNPWLDLEDQPVRYNMNFGKAFKDSFGDYRGSPEFLHFTCYHLRDAEESLNSYWQSRR